MTFSVNVHHVTRNKWLHFVDGLRLQRDFDPVSGPLHTHTHTPQGNIHTHQLEKTDMFNDENLSCGEAAVVQRKHLNLPNDFEEV